MNEGALRQDIVEACRRLYLRGMVAANDGNISARISETEILITPTGVSKGYITADQIILVGTDGAPLSGYMKPSSEMKMHLAVYASRPDVRAVVHAHPPHATAFAVAGLRLDRVSLAEAVLALGNVALAEYGTPSTQEIPQAVQRHIAHSDALLLANHGALTVGTEPMDAYFKMESLEHYAHITLLARLLGGEKELDARQRGELMRVRAEVYGKKNLPCANGQ